MTKATKDEDVLATAKKRYESAMDRSSHNREKARADLKFLAATPDDPWQWSDTDIQKRNGRPTLTINKAPGHVRQVTNDMRQNRPAIKYRPADSKADPEVAEILMGIARHIEANSDADVAYDSAAEGQVAHGTGYVRVLADYISAESFDQDIFIRTIDDSFKVTDDPDAIDPAGADRKFLFIEEQLTEEEFKRQYPKADVIDWAFDTKGGDWFADKKVLVAEYFEVCYREKTLNLWANGETSFEGEPLPQGVYEGEKPVKTRKSQQPYCLWRKINGKEILEEKEFPSKYIPVARAWGNHYVIDGKTYVFGLVRGMKDSQRMYNVAQSSIVERVMQAPKAPYMAPVEAIEGYEPTWQTANTGNHSFLPYNHLDEQGNPIPAPSRVQPTTIEPGLIQIAQSSADDIKSETGQYDASLGSRSNETSGRAIMARQREGDTATYHYTDNLARMVRHVGRIVLDMIPKIYDTKRVARILGEDGSIAKATLDPEHPQAMTEYEDDEGAMQRIFNPSVGTYDVYTTTGPSFTTRRVEAVEAMTQMTQANPQLWQVIGDQLVKNMDWPGAEEMADRLRLTLLPEVRDMANQDGKADQLPPQAKMAMDHMQQQGQQMAQELEACQKELDHVKNDSRIDAWKAETERLKLVLPYLPAGALAQIAQTVGLQVLASDDISPPDHAMQQAIPGDAMQGPPPQMQEQPEQPPSGGFSLPEAPLQPEQMPPEAGFHPQGL